MGATTGTISGIGAAAQYSATNNRDIFTGKPVGVSNANNASSMSQHASIRGTERNVSQIDINDALQKLLQVNEIKTDALGRPSVKYIGVKATVIVNPETGKIITVYPTSSKISIKYRKD